LCVCPFTRRVTGTAPASAEADGDSSDFFSFEPFPKRTAPAPIAATVTPAPARNSRRENFRLDDSGSWLLSDIEHLSLTIRISGQNRARNFIIADSAANRLPPRCILTDES
jgi:hypothetical protein